MTASEYIDRIMDLHDEISSETWRSQEALLWDQIGNRPLTADQRADHKARIADLTPVEKALWDLIDILVPDDETINVTL